MTTANYLPTQWENINPDTRVIFDHEGNGRVSVQGNADGPSVSDEEITALLNADYDVTLSTFINWLPGDADKWIGSFCYEIA